MMQHVEAATAACVVYGPLVAAVVAALKRLGFVGRFLARHAPTVAAVASVVVTAVTVGALPVGQIAWQQFALCVAVTFAGAVATHEVVDANVGKKLGLTDPKGPKGS